MHYDEVKLYEGREDVRLTAYILDDSVEMLNGGKKGAILICPGGGYLYCSDREGEPVAMAFAAMGYHTFVLRYSVYNENKGANTLENIFPDMSKPWVEKPNVKFPGPVRDVGRAMLYIKEHATDWHIDMEKVALCGFSAGGHNCLMYSIYYNQPIVTDFLGIGTEGLRPAAVVLGYTASDYMPLVSEDAENNPMTNAINLALMGTDGITDKELAMKLSPCRLVNENTPPMFLWTTAIRLINLKRVPLRFAPGQSTRGLAGECMEIRQRHHTISCCSKYPHHHALLSIDATHYLDYTMALVYGQSTSKNLLFSQIR